jgi:hypothetical protein
MDNTQIFLNTQEQCQMIQEFIKAQTEMKNRVLAMFYGDVEE